jgi:hypothetical protein
MSGPDDHLLERAKAAARLETAPADLAERVLGAVESRRRSGAALTAAARVRRLALVSSSIVAAAAVFWLYTRTPTPLPHIAPEQSKSSSASAPSVPPPRAQKPAPDPCRDRVIASGVSPLLDDFEDGDDALAALDQRAGFWRWARETDAPGTAPALLPVPRTGGGARNKRAVHVKGGRLFDWGATVEVSFEPPCYDATAYVGIKLQARGPGRVYVALREVDVIPIAEGGSCERDCHNPHAAKIELSPEWRSYELRWAELRPRGIDTPPLDTSRLHSVAFLIHPEDTPYDLWLDEVQFLSKK